MSGPRQLLARKLLAARHCQLIVRASKHTCLHVQLVERPSVGCERCCDGADPVHSLPLQLYGWGSWTLIIAICQLLLAVGSRSPMLPI